MTNITDLIKSSIVLVDIIIWKSCKKKMIIDKFMTSQFFMCCTHSITLFLDKIIVLPEINLRLMKLLQAILKPNKVLQKLI